MLNDDLTESVRTEGSGSYDGACVIWDIKVRCEEKMIDGLAELTSHHCARTLFTLD